MGNYTQDGNIIDYTPSVDVVAGAVVVQGELVGVTVRNIAANTLGAIVVAGVFVFAKEGGVGVVFAIGELAYWDDGAGFAVKTDGGGSNKLIGKAVSAAADGDTSLNIRLDQ